MSDNWVVQNLENALATWNEKLAEIWQLITQSPETFKGGTIWNVVLLIHDTMQAIGLALLVLFFVVGVVKTCGSFAEIKRPEGGGKALYPLCAGQSRRDLRTGTDDGPVHHCAGRYFLHHVGSRDGCSAGDGASRRNRDRH